MGNLQRDDLVLIVIDNVPRSHWLLMQVVGNFPVDDIVVRSVNVKTLAVNTRDRLINVLY